jgi:hypothetical protein
MAWKNFGNSSLQVQEQWPDDEDDDEEEEMERAGTALTSSNLLVTSCSSSSSNILFTGDAREGEEAIFLDGRSVAGGVSGRSNDSMLSGRVSAWVSDVAEGTGVALVAVETDDVMTGIIGLSEAICTQCSLLAAGESGVRSIAVIM